MVGGVLGQKQVKSCETISEGWGAPRCHLLTCAKTFGWNEILITVEYSIITFAKFHAKLQKCMERASSWMSPGALESNPHEKLDRKENMAAWWNAWYLWTLTSVEKLSLHIKSPVAFFASVGANKSHTDFYSSKIIMAIWLYVLQPFEILTLGNSGNATNATIKQTMQLKLQQLHWNNDITIIC